MAMVTGLTAQKLSKFKKSRTKMVNGSTAKRRFLVSNTLRVYALVRQTVVYISPNLVRIGGAQENVVKHSRSTKLTQIPHVISSNNIDLSSPLAMASAALLSCDII